MTTIPSKLPGVAYAAPPVTADHTSPLILPPRLVVIHDTSNDATAPQEAAYAASRPLAGATSAHFYVDESVVLGSLSLRLQAWAAYGYANARGWHIEMCGYNAGMRRAVPASTIARTAALVRQLCALGGVPMTKLSPDQVASGARGICGHRDITIGLGVGTHDDPGELFDWPAFIAAVRGDDVEPVEVWTGVKWGTQTAADRLLLASQSAKPSDVTNAVKPVADAVAELAARPPVTAAPVDIAALVAALGPEMEAAAERAVKRVLGAVDGATPQGS